MVNSDKTQDLVKETVQIVKCTVFHKIKRIYSLLNQTENWQTQKYILDQVKM